VRPAAHDEASSRDDDREEAAVVGTVLSAVNQGSVISGGDATPATWARVGVNYLVPFLVSSVGFLSACRDREAG
jgi:hypothetical protein